MADSIRKQITDNLISRLKGDFEIPRPNEIGNDVRVNKNRGAAVGKDELPMYSVYFVHDAPQPIGGDRRRPSVQQHSLTLEVRIITPGTDDDADPHCQWITACIASADRVVVDGQQLALGVSELETGFEPLQADIASFTVTRMRWLIEYTTNPRDITQTR